MDTNTMTTKFMDMLNKRDNGLMQKILEAEDLDMQTLMDMFKAANNKYFAKLQIYLLYPVLLFISISSIVIF